MSTSLHRLAAFGAVLALGAGGLAACGSNNGNTAGGSPSSGDPSSGGGGGAISAVCDLSDIPTSAASAPASGGDTTGKASGRVGVILPDTTSSTRYTKYDAPLLKKALSDAGITPDIQNAGGSTARFVQIAQSMINQGVKVLIIDSIDAQSGAGVEQLADRANIDVIDYDRVNLGGTAPYYVSFDNEDVGKLQAQTMVDCLDQQGVQNPNIIMMDGGIDVDNNAVLFAKGAHEVLDPLEDAGKLTIVSESVVKGWKVENAAGIFQQALTAGGGDVEGVVAANDDIANAVIGVLKTQGLDGSVVVTGQDSGVEGLQNIITGKQSMTIFKDVKLEAQAASELAIALIQGKDAAAAGLQLTDFADPMDSSHDIQALLLPAQVIIASNVSDVIDAGALSQQEICQNIEDACAQIGLN